MRFLLALLLGAHALAGATAAEVARSIREIALDPGECYRVRDLTLVREDIRIYFTDGYLIFAKPVAGRPVAAVFTADVENGDGEILLLPPNRGERRSLAAYTSSPNLNEHFGSAVLLFSDDTYDALAAQLRAGASNRKVPEMGLLASEKWSPVVRNLATSFETRLALDLLSGANGRTGLFAATLAGRKLGNFDVLCDPRFDEQILIGQVASRDNRTYFDIWCSFEARSWRANPRPAAAEFNLHDYRIDALLEPDLNLRATVRVKVAAATPQRVLPFDLTRAVRLSAVTVDGRPAEFLQRDSMRANLVRNTGNDLVLVVPPEPLAPGRDHEIEFREEGRVVVEAGNQVYFVGARGNWYPNRRMQFATYDLTFRYPKDLDLVTPGEIVQDSTSGDWRVTRRRTSAPVRMAGFNLGRYDRVRVSRARYTVEVCANQALEKALEAHPEPVIISQPPPFSGRRAPPAVFLPSAIPAPPASRVRLQELAADIASSLEFMASRLGPPALNHLTVSPIPGAFGQGFPGLLYLSTFTYLKREDRTVAAMKPEQQVFFAELLQAHETAHQWWGNVITSAGYHDDWLMEALANYTALLYVEKRKGQRTFDMMMEQYRTDLLTKTESGEIVEAAGPIVLGGRLESSLSPQSWRHIVYGKGSWIIHMLRRRMGDARFYEMLAELRRRYDSRPVSTEQFRAVAARFLPPRGDDPDLSAFFDQFVYGTGIPALKLKWSIKGKGKAMRVEGAVTQTEVDKEFTVPVPVEIQFARGKPVTRVVSTGAEPATFSVPVAAVPVKVTLDPRWSVLRR